LLDLLARYRLRATFFVVGKQAEAYPELIAGILAGGHSIGNHSYEHSNFLMLHSPESLFSDIEKTQKILAKGRHPSPRLPTSRRDCQSGVGAGARQDGFESGQFQLPGLRSRQQEYSPSRGRILRHLRPGDILLLHDISPADRSLSADWRQELDVLFRNLAEQHRVLPLEELIGHPVMVPVPAQSE